MGLNSSDTLAYKSGDYINDANGIQILMLKNGISSNINITNSSFKNCARRGIKIQTGNNISIKNNQFENCRAAIGMPAVQPLDSIQIQGNYINQSKYVISPNGNKKSIISHLFIKNNEVSNVRDFIRTNGECCVINSIIIENDAKNLEIYFASGLFKNVRFEKNTITDFALLEDPSYYMAFLIWNGSENVEILNNTISTNAVTHCAIYNQRGVKNCIIKDNKISLPNNKSSNRYIIYFKDEKNGKVLNKSLNNRLDGQIFEQKN